MIEMTIEMKLLPRKRKELLMTLRGLLAAIRRLQGCLACHACQDIENSRIMNLVVAWDSQENLKHRLQSKLFSALVGAIRLLCESHKIKIKDIAYHQSIDPFLECIGSEACKPLSDLVKGSN